MLRMISFASGVGTLVATLDALSKHRKAVNVSANVELLIALVLLIACIACAVAAMVLGEDE